VTPPPSSPTEALPAVSEVVAEFRRTLEDDDRPRPDGVLGVLVALHRTNAAQWRLEDEVRVPGADDATIAAAKRAIDRMNSLRHLHVEAVDGAIGALLAQVPDAPPSTESPGMAFDRLSVLTIRMHHTQLAARADRSGEYEGRLPHLAHQLETLQTALSVLLEEIASGTRQFLAYQSLKLYGS